MRTKDWTPRCVHCESKLKNDGQVMANVGGHARKATRYFCSEGTCNVAQVVIYAAKTKNGWELVQEHLTTVD